MTDTNAADHRRATALVVHYGHRDEAGIAAVFAEAIDADPTLLPLIGAVLDLHAGIIPTLLTENGLACLQDALLTACETGTGLHRAAAQLIVARERGDYGQLAAVLNETIASGQDHPADVLVVVLAVFEAAVPLMYGRLALSALQGNVLNWAAREENTDDD